MHVLSFNILVVFTWFTKDDRCLIKGLWTEKNGAQHLIKEFLNKRWSLSTWQVLSVCLNKNNHA